MSIIKIFISPFAIVWLVLYCHSSFASSLSVTEITADAERGDPVAQYQLGQLYKGGGQGLSQDYNEAKKWYRKSAEQGYAPAETALGIRIFKADEEEAYKWFQKAADQGDISAKAFLYLRKYSFLPYIRSLPQDVRDVIFFTVLAVIFGVFVLTVALLARLIIKHTPARIWKRFFWVTIIVIATKLFSSFNIWARL